MRRILWVAAIWVFAAIAIAVAFATERLHWPELWLGPVTLIATCIACYLAPKHRWRWLAASPLIAGAAFVFISMVLLGSLSHQSRARAETWLHGQFSGAAPADPDQVPALRPIADRHGGLADVDCYDNIPLQSLGWECRATFRDGKGLTLDAWATWSRRSARTEGRVTDSR